MAIKNHGQTPGQKAHRQLESEHASGIHIAKAHLTPFLLELTQKYQFSRIEIASALIVLAYNTLRKDRPAAKAKILFNILANKSQAFIDVKENHKLN